jgi:hypothetical protein
MFTGSGGSSFPGFPRFGFFFAAFAPFARCAPPDGMLGVVSAGLRMSVELSALAVRSARAPRAGARVRAAL